MNTHKQHGFTLIELLTVIAIIGILAGMITIGLPIAIERAKLAKLQNVAKGLNTEMVAHYTAEGTFPPGYGFIRWESRALPYPGTADDVYFHLTNYMAELEKQNHTDAYDMFSDATGYDADSSGSIDFLEFAPYLDTASTLWYNGANEAAEVAAQLGANEERPFIYAPVNKRQFELVQKYWMNNDQNYANVWNPAAADFPRISFPPPKYDAYVLISVGPTAMLGGIGTVPPAGVDYTNPYAYHITALRTYYLATRDLNQNGVKDFDYIARRQQNENIALDDAGETYALPDGTNLYGPVIFASQ